MTKIKSSDTLALLREVMNPDEAASRAVIAEGLLGAFDKISNTLSPGVPWALVRINVSCWEFQIGYRCYPFVTREGIVKGISDALDRFVRETNDLMQLRPGWRIPRMGDPRFTWIAT
jgi:hypothetical protein